jgi:hypothetical protein
LSFLGFSENRKRSRTGALGSRRTVPRRKHLFQVLGEPFRGENISSRFSETGEEVENGRSRFSKNRENRKRSRASALGSRRTGRGRERALSVLGEPEEVESERSRFSEDFDFDDEDCPA